VCGAELEITTYLPTRNGAGDFRADVRAGRSISFVHRRTTRYTPTMTTLTVSAARAALPEILDRVTDGEEVTITRHGRAVAVVVRPDVLRSRRAQGAAAAVSQVREALLAGARSPDAPGKGLSRSRAEELIADVRASRAAR
jgi:prevent-host-death family protein